MGIDKENYYFVKYSEHKLKNEDEEKLSTADAVANKQIKEEYQRNWEEFCETHKVEYEGFLRVSRRKQLDAYCSFLCMWFWLNKTLIIKSTEETVVSFVDNSK